MLNHKIVSNSENSISWIDPFLPRDNGLIQKIFGTGSMQDVIDFLYDTGKKKNILRFNEKTEYLFLKALYILSQKVFDAHIDIYRISQMPKDKSLYIKRISAGSFEKIKSRFYFERVSPNQIRMHVVYTDDCSILKSKIVVADVKVDNKNRMYVEVDYDLTAIKKNKMYVRDLNSPVINLKEDTLYARTLRALQDTKTVNYTSSKEFILASGKVLGYYMDSIPKDLRTNQIKRGIFSRKYVQLIRFIQSSTEIKNKEKYMVDLQNYLFSERVFVNIGNQNGDPNLPTTYYILQANRFDSYCNSILNSLKKGHVVRFHENNCFINEKPLSRMSENFDAQARKVKTVLEFSRFIKGLILNYREQQRIKWMEGLIANAHKVRANQKFDIKNPQCFKTGDLKAIVNMFPFQREEQQYGTQIEIKFNRSLAHEKSDIRQALFFMDLLKKTQFHLGISVEDKAQKETLDNINPKVKLEENNTKLVFSFDIDLFSPFSSMLMKFSKGARELLLFKSDSTNNEIEESIVEDIPSFWIHGHNIVTINFREMKIVEFSYNLYKDQTFKSKRLKEFLINVYREDSIRAFYNKCLIEDHAMNVFPLIEKITESFILFHNERIESEKHVRPEVFINAHNNRNLILKILQQKSVIYPNSKLYPALLNFVENIQITNENFIKVYQYFVY